MIDGGDDGGGVTRRRVSGSCVQSPGMRRRAIHVTRGPLF
jgi:hypothetical protein